MFDHLQIYDSRERALVGSADLLLNACLAASRLAARVRMEPPQRILVLRLERIGDLLMTLGALEAVRTRAPAAKIHLVVGSWNEAIARLVPAVDSIETLDVPWLVRHGAGASMRRLVRQAWSWRARGFDVALNFEPDIRSNLLLALSGAPRRVGFSSAGGGAFLTTGLVYEPGHHTAANALRVVDAALPSNDAIPSAGSFPRLAVPDTARQEASRLLEHVDPSRPLVGLHASGGREIKQWHMERFAEVATRLARELGAVIVLTGAAADRPLIDRITALLDPDVRVLDAAGSIEMPVFAALVERLRLFVTCDTGPMHLAAAVGTQVVALFGPSDPARYGPLSDRAVVMTADLWCRPCNRVRRPPDRCCGRVPDCLSAIDAPAVLHAARELLKQA